MANLMDDQRARAFGRLVGRINQRLIRDIAKRQTLIGDISHAQKMVLVLLKVEGSRISDLAKRMYVSKQAVSKTVQELEIKGLVTRKPDLADKRAYIIKFTPQGIKIVEDTLVYFSEIEGKLKEEFGDDQFDDIIRHLVALAKFMDPDGF